MALVALAFLFGAVIGSFLNVVIYRLPRHESLVQPRSRCPSCQAPIAAYHNIPIVAWLFLHGRCRECGERISVRYPLVELATAALFATAVVIDGASEQLLLTLPFIAVMIAVALVDLDHRIVPNKILLAATVWLLPVSLLLQSADVPEQLLAAAIAGGLLLVAALLYPGGMGMGDVKLAAVMGLFLGKAVAPALLIAFLSGTLFGLVLILKYGKQARKLAVPFAPFLALGGISAQFVGLPLVEWYADQFL